MISCVYVVTNLVNGKQYVGKTMNFKRRKANHLSYSRNPHSRNFTPICAAIHKYGEENFQWDIVFESQDEKELFKYEEQLSIQLNTLLPNGYNQIFGGGGSSKGGPVEVECAICHTKFIVERHKFNRYQKGKFKFICSHECGLINKSNNSRGKKNNKYKHGKRMKHV